MHKCKLGQCIDVKRGTSLSGSFYSESGEKIRLTLGNFNYPNGGLRKIHQKQIYILQDQLDKNLS